MLLCATSERKSDRRDRRSDRTTDENQGLGLGIELI
jgi:hypothetical protein